MPSELEVIKRLDASGNLTQVAELLAFPLWILSPDGECVYVNRRWQELTGQKLEEAREKGWERCLHPSGLSDYRREREIAGPSREFSLLVHLRRFDGENRFFHLFFSPRQVSNGDSSGHIVYGIDIHDNKRPLVDNPEGTPEESHLPQLNQTPAPPAAPVPATSPQKALEVLLAREERFCWMLDNIPAMVVALDSQNRIVSWNRECEHVTGYRSEEALVNEGLFVRLFPHSNDREWLMSQNGNEKKSYYEHECEISCKSGTLRTIAIKKVAKKVPIPGLTSWWVATDITDRKRSEIDLREREARLRLAMQAGRMGIWDWNLQNNEVVFSETQEPLWGIPCGSFAGTYQAFMDRVHPDDRAQLSKVIREAIEQKRDYEQEFRLVWPDGSHRWILGKGQGLYDETGQPIRLLSLSMDITERKRSAIEKRSMERRLQEAQKFESIGVLASGIAHDFNNILTSILGNATLAQMERSPTDEVQPYLKRIEDASLRAADLCNQMLAYSGEGRHSEKNLDLNKLIQDAESTLNSLIGKKAVLTYHLSPNLPAIYADPSKVLQVLNNLVVNASEALGDKGGAIVISSAAVHVKRDSFGDYIVVSDPTEATYVALEITDNGCGMNRETMGRAFDPFFSTKFLGRGLGLAAVQGIVRRHHGAIKLQSQPGSGTTMQILFPSLAERGTDESLSQTDLQGTILAIDDEQSVLAVVAGYLKSFGLKVVLARDGDEGVALFREKADEISAVMLDLTMPRMDGVTTFRELQRIRDGVPVLLMSGYMEQDALVEFAGQGLAGFIQKPFSRDALRQKLAAILQLESAANRL